MSGFIFPVGSMIVLGEWRFATSKETRIALNAADVVNGAAINMRLHVGEHPCHSTGLRQKASWRWTIFIFWPKVQGPEKGSLMGLATPKTDEARRGPRSESGRHSPWWPCVHLSCYQHANCDTGQSYAATRIIRVCFANLKTLMLSHHRPSHFVYS